VKPEKIKQLAAIGLQLSITGNLFLAIASRYARLRVKDGPDLIGPAQQQEYSRNQTGFVSDTVVAKTTLAVLASKTLSLDAKLVAAALALQRVAGGRRDGLDTVELRDQTGLKKSAVSRALEELAVGGYVYAYLGRFRTHWLIGDGPGKLGTTND
jgi:hypothetical protein